jgi:hypothetical protein
MIIYCASAVNKARDKKPHCRDHHTLTDGWKLELKLRASFVSAMNAGK